MVFDFTLFAQIITENTAVAIPLVGTMVAATWILARKLDKIDTHIKRAWTVEDQQTWKDEAIEMNPKADLKLPSPYEIIRKRKGQTTE